MAHKLNNKLTVSWMTGVGIGTWIWTGTLVKRNKISLTLIHYGLIVFCLNQLILFEQYLKLKQMKQKHQISLNILTHLLFHCVWLWYVHLYWVWFINWYLLLKSKTKTKRNVSSAFFSYQISIDLRSVRISSLSIATTL